MRMRITKQSWIDDERDRDPPCTGAELGMSLIGMSPAWFVEVRDLEHLLEIVGEADEVVELEVERGVPVLRIQDVGC